MTHSFNLLIFKRLSCYFALVITMILIFGTDLFLFPDATLIVIGQACFIVIFILSVLEIIMSACFDNPLLVICALGGKDENNRQIPFVQLLFYLWFVPL